MPHGSLSGWLNIQEFSESTIPVYEIIPNTTWHPAFLEDAVSAGCCLLKSRRRIEQLCFGSWTHLIFACQQPRWGTSIRWCYTLLPHRTAASRQKSEQERESMKDWCAFRRGSKTSMTSSPTLNSHLLRYSRFNRRCKK